MDCPKCGGRKGRGAKMIKEHDIPFACPDCKGINFPLQAIKDRVFLFPIDIYKKKLTSTSIIIPDSVKSKKESEYGIVMTIGPGYFMNSGVFFKPEIEVGDRVAFDKGVPWSWDAEGTDGKKHTIKVMGYQDVKALTHD